MRITREYQNWSLSNKPQLNLVRVETYGVTVAQALENATITLEDWHGNEGPDWGVEDLNTTDYECLREDLTKLLMEAGV